ncbi:hypothetical protein A6V39_04610 [Candidatus Mycoplasma haematobovis]|uniref:Uncharacterized protein n=1 Tax=Candidatus Mycoplasma haematobovis TaxID=432608 RepID=A0A1A9QDZ0_9MOLU|nr:hypothetical protein [Candidatus Mycoplasma haematobovis]OAL10166.1 hypothetical protein A6V39_04610 [Candidatus Mycoplasma haematobovis]
MRDSCSKPSFSFIKFLIFSIASLPPIDIICSLKLVNSCSLICSSDLIFLNSSNCHSTFETLSNLDQLFNSLLKLIIS